MEKRLMLKRELSLSSATLCGVGIILGAGIYALIGKAAALSGNAVWISFLLASLIAFFTAFSYAELSSIFPKASAEYIFTKKSYGNLTAFLVGVLMVIGSGAIAAATVAIGFAGYFNSLFHTPIIPTAIVLIILLSLIIYKGIKQSAKLAILFTLIEAAGLIFVIFLGIPYIGSIDYLTFPSLKGIFSAAALIFFAYLGFEEMARLSEETKKPRKTIPIAIVLALIISTILYILVAVSAVSILPWQQLGASTAPLADVASSALGTKAYLIISIIALFATANTSLLILLAASRITYGMAKSKSLPKFLGKLNKNQTPGKAIFWLMIITILFTFMGNIDVVAAITDFSLFATFIVINASLIHLRYKYPKLKRPFKAPLNIGKFPLLAFLGIITSFILLFSLETKIILYGAGLILIGLIIYKLKK